MGKPLPSVLASTFHAPPHDPLCSGVFCLWGFSFDTGCNSDRSSSVVKTHISENVCLFFLCFFSEADILGGKQTLAVIGSLRISCWYRIFPRATHCEHGFGLLQLRHGSFVVESKCVLSIVSEFVGVKLMQS